MPSFTNKMPSRPLPPLMHSDSDGFSYTQSGSGSPNHYHDIESLKLTLGKSRPGRKTSREKSTIWTECSEVEKERTTSNTGHKKSKSITNSATLKPSKSSKKGDKLSKQQQSLYPPEPVRFLESPLLQTVDQNWTLPRVELWCRDPQCGYNQRLWGDHYTYQHQNNNPNPTYYRGGGFAIPEVDEESDEVYLTDRTPSAGYYTRSSDNSSSGGTTASSQNNPNHYDIHTATTMVLDPHSRHGSKGGGRGPTALTGREQMHLNMNMGINNFGSKDGITITHTNNTNSKSDNTFTTKNSNPSNGLRGNSGNKNGMMTMTQTPMDTIGSSISSNSNTTDSSTILTIHTESTTGSGAGILGLGESSTNRSPSEGFSASTFLTGFDSSTSSASTSTTGSGAGSSTGLCKPVGHDIVNHRNNNGQCVYSQAVATNNSNTGQYNHQQTFRPPSTTPPVNPYCPNCSGVVPLNHLDNGPADQGAGGRLKGDPGFWQFNKFQHPLQRDHSFHSVGGFTLNGQYNTTVKKHTMVKFCSSHKISLVVSTFSLLVTIGLLITLFLMKKRGMMDTMMDS